MIAYFNYKLQPLSSSNVASSSGVTITALPGMAYSSSTLRFIAILQATSSVLRSNSWIVDSGATHHVTCDKNRFESLSATLNASVTLPNGLGVKIEGVSCVRLSDHLVLNNVLYVPKFRMSLMSVSQVTKDLGYQIIFDGSSCVIHDHIKGLMIGQGEEITNLYVLDTTTLPTLSNKEPLLFCSNVIVDSALWHTRLGHPSMIKTVSLSDVLGFQPKNKIIFVLFSILPNKITFLIFLITISVTLLLICSI